ncbi:MAG: hypothetical protein ACRDNB_01870 [Gaiellaceae bacterium]
MRSRSLVAGVSIVAVALSIGWLLSLATTRVKNWFVMSDELYYERLAVAVAQTGSLLPRVHGELVSNVNQLYPVLLSTMYGSGNVPASLEGAHRLNAFVIATAAIPVFLLARRIGLGLALAVATGALAVAVPWVVLSSFLLTEVVAYPAFCWALLALVHAIDRKTWVWDAVALLAIGLAVLARTQFVVLVAVLIVAVAVEAALTMTPRRAAAELWRTRRPLVVLYGALLAVILVAVSSGNGSRLLGSYAVTAENVRLDLDLLELTFAHVAVVALGLALLPFLVGCAWLVDRMRPSAAPAERAFAVVGTVTIVLLALQVASFTQRFGFGLVKDRYLFYIAPIVLIGLAAAVADRTWPRWWALAVPASVVAVGFAFVPVTRYEKLNVDTPIAMLNDGLLDLATSQTWGRVMLVLLTAVVLQALLLARAFLPWRPIGAAVGMLAALALPLETAYAFERLFRVDGTNGLPITLDQGVVFSWIDRNVGPTGRVTVFKYPVLGADWFAGQAYWWDVEFWNESAVRTAADMSLPDAKHWSTMFDERTGAALDPPATQFALLHGTDVRFRVAGTVRLLDRDAYLVEPERPWRATWMANDIWADGFTREKTPATISVFPEPGQTGPLQRFITLSIASPSGTPTPVRVTSEMGEWEAEIAPETSFEPQVSVCVPPDRPGRVTITTPAVSLVYPDPTKTAPNGRIDRPVGVLLRSAALADETVPLERCPA